MQQRAKDLRGNLTDAEKLLWRHLRSRRLEGDKFRRQQVIDPYIVDFVCFEKKLIVELDGGQHAESISYDHRRSLFLEAAGFKVMRFWNNEVLGNLESVLSCIRAECAVAPSPQPFYEGGFVKRRPVLRAGRPVRLHRFDTACQEAGLLAAPGHCPDHLLSVSTLWSNTLCCMRLVARGGQPFAPRRPISQDGEPCSPGWGTGAVDLLTRDSASVDYVCSCACSAPSYPALSCAPGGITPCST